MALEKPLEEVEGRPVRPLRVPLLPNLYAAVLAAAIVVIGLFWDQLSSGSERGVNNFYRTPQPAALARGGP